MTKNEKIEMIHHAMVSLKNQILFLEAQIKKIQQKICDIDIEIMELADDGKVQDV